MLLGSITDLSRLERGGHVIVGSHGGAAVGQLALSHGVASFICHDAGIGLGGAGVAALQVLNSRGVPAAAVSHRTARIGEPEDMLERGRISEVNQAAEALGVVRGLPVAVAYQRMQIADPPATSHCSIDVFRCSQIEIAGQSPGRAVQVKILDSVSSVSATDDGAIIVTGSHGGLPGGCSRRALKASARLVAFNDAGIGIDNAGTRRLPVLDREGIAAVCVDAATARIGDGMSSYETGMISAANTAAERMGAKTGMALKKLLALVAKAPVPTGPGF